jgi:hypothetical protein
VGPRLVDVYPVNHSRVILHPTSSLARPGQRAHDPAARTGLDALAGVGLRPWLGSLIFEFREMHSYLHRLLIIVMGDFLPQLFHCLTRFRYANYLMYMSDKSI